MTRIWAHVFCPSFETLRHWLGLFLKRISTVPTLSFLPYLLRITRDWFICPSLLDCDVFVHARTSLLMFSSWFFFCLLVCLWTGASQLHWSPQTEDLRDLQICWFWLKLKGDRVSAVTAPRLLSSYHSALDGFCYPIHLHQQDRRVIAFTSNQGSPFNILHRDSL